MKYNIFPIGRSGKSKGSAREIPNQSTSVDVREEYANAFRTESYTEFWTRVLELSNPNVIPLMECLTAERLPSYRLFVEHLLDPDQLTITQLLTSTQPQNRPENHSLLLDYFSQTADVSQLCALLIKDINQTRTLYRPLKTTFESLPTSSENHFPTIFNRLTEFSNCLNSFGSSVLTRFKDIQVSCGGLLKRLELSRQRVHAKVKLVKGLKRGVFVCVMTITATIVVVVVSHALAMLVVVPGFITNTRNLASSKRLDCMSAQLEAAARGTYILNKDLETIGRHVTRLNDEIEHVREMVKFWLEKKEDVESVQPSREVVAQLRKNESSFMEQLDELEEHLYLCFMTINRARTLVMKEVLELTKH